MSAMLFDDTEYLPLLSNCVVPVIEKEVRAPAVTQDQMLLGAIECHCCMDTGKVTVGKNVRRCWCLVGQSFRSSE